MIVLEKDKHYIPMYKNFSNFHHKILWAKKHDKIVQKVASDSSKFASKYFFTDQTLSVTETDLRNGYTW